MLNIHFTDADLAHVCVADRPDPLWETVLGIQQLTGPARVPPIFAPWWHRARREVHERGLTAAAQVLTGVAPEGAPYFPDFLTPAEAASGVLAGLDALRGTPRPRLRRELELLGPRQRGAGWVQGLAGGSPLQMEELTAALLSLYRTVIVPDWTRVMAGADADWTVRSRALRSGGVHGLLDSLRPVARWEPPVLRVAYPMEKELHLRGRGIRLIPSFFCWRTAVALADPALPPVLVYPVARTPEDPPDPARTTRPAALVSLLGRTRARVLATLVSAASTGELACRLQISPASASKHAASLREAGLVVSLRQGSFVLHTITPLGRALLLGELPVGP
ncbi:winged helix-turn-helix domain-containing protein [Streptomyces sp. NBC_01387]|uniref:ArsR/SmtB family transcription factor n=1 Tax=Streptomyces sp. NBC_01387 TaxID=2903849 RepID=UPI00324DF4E8